jgi:GNAT superfamily N-acetyltransferase
VGFGAFTPDGHLDLLYTHARFLRQGIGAALLGFIEDEARAVAARVDFDDRVNHYEVVETI